MASQPEGFDPEQSPDDFPEVPLKDRLVEGLIAAKAQSNRLNDAIRERVRALNVTLLVALGTVSLLCMLAWITIMPRGFEPLSKLAPSIAVLVLFVLYHIMAVILAERQQVFRLRDLFHDLCDRIMAAEREITLISQQLAGPTSRG